ncbi:MAG: hypothetical protein HJJLKODD_01590 [Phycisphaerae bacterium]|nr:hypothetical protein [Phycisphaerae bacterium]
MSHGKKQHHGGGGDHEEHEGAPEWLISFADNVTLMMGFFVILLATYMAKVGGGKGDDGSSGSVADVAIAVRKAFKNPVDLSKWNPSDAVLIQRIMELQGQANEDGLPGKHPDVETIRPSDYFSIGGLIHFETKSSVVDEANLVKVNKLAEQMVGLRLVVDVRGHVSAAEAFENPEAAMKLSYERAVAVAAALVQKGLQWEQIRIIACGDNERLIKTAYDPLSHSVNQRVEVVPSDDALSE